MSTVTYPIAFAAGFVTFFATCLLPVLPVYLGYLGGISTQHVSQDTGVVRKKVLTHSLLFVAGFLLVFSTLGLAATAAGRFLSGHRMLFQQLGGIVLILMGIVMTGVLRIPALLRSYQIRLRVPTRPVSAVGAFVLGLTFGFAWTPCIGPVLASILFIASHGTSVWYGASLLAVFAVGLGLPFVIVGLFFHVLSPFLGRLGRYTHYLQIVFGVMIILAGILLATNRLGLVSQWALRWGGGLVVYAANLSI